MNAALAKGTWYVNRKPMLVTSWGIKPGANRITEMPIWVKFTNIPDCYWTKEGLSNLASVIGRPRGADQLTSKLEIMPFAMMQIQYELGDPLPNEIKVKNLHPVTQEKTVETVLVSYPDRPLVCSGCKSLGHLVAVCPVTKQVWKEIGPTNISEKNVQAVVESPQRAVVIGIEKDQGKKEDSGWTEVKRKSAGISSSGDEDSPSPLKTFQNLKNIDEIDIKKKAICLESDIGSSSSGKRLSKSQKKRLKQSKGVSPPRFT